MMQRNLTRFVRNASTKQRRAAVSSVPVNPLQFPSSMTEQAPATGPNFIQQLSNENLVSYALLSLVTSNPLLLKTAIVTLPYTPNFLVKKVVYPIYCGGENFAEVRENSRRLLDRGIGNQMLSYSVEDANGTLSGSIFDDVVKRVCDSIPEVLVKNSEVSKQLYESGEVDTAPASGYIALKPTGLMEGATQILANFDKPEYATKWQLYLQKCRDICQYAVDHGNNNSVIVFDAEKKWLQDGVYAAQREMMKEFNRDGKVIVAGTLQMYLKESVPLLEYEIEQAKLHNYQVAMKLVRGAYIHSEPNRWEVIHNTQEDTDNAYNTGCNMMLDHITETWRTGKAGPVGRLIVASHNDASIDMVNERITREAPLGFDLDKDESVVFGQLLGMREDLGTKLAANKRKVVKYVPWGPVNETKDYLRRRLEENSDAARGGWEEFVASCKELGRRAKLPL